MNKTLSVSAIAAVLLLAGCGPKEEPAAPPATSEAAAPSAAADVEAPAAAAADVSAGQGTAGDVASDTTPETGATTATADAIATPAPASATPVSAQPATPPVAPAKATSPTPTTSLAAAAAAPTAPAAAATTAKPTATATPTTTAAVAAPSSSAVTFNGDPATIIRAETLRARPAADAPAIAPLAAGAKVKVLARDGGWYQVSIDSKSGWVRMLSVRRSEAATTDVAGLAGIASGRTGTGKVVTTTGVRGLDSGDLAAATFNEERIARAETLRVTKSDADAFARQGGLVTQTVPALPAPAK